MRKTEYTQEPADEICRRISEGTSLRQICRDEGMAESDGARLGSRQPPRVRRGYEAARRLQADAWADEIVLLANRDDLDPQDKRVRIDTLKWLSSKILPLR